MMKALMAAAALSLVATSALAARPCEELKAGIEARLRVEGVQAYTPEIVPNADVKDGRVVGSCNGGTEPTRDGE